MRILFFGTPQVAAEHLRVILKNTAHQVVGAVTRPDAPKGRGQQVQASPVKEFAQNHGLAVFAPQRLAGPEILNPWIQLAPDLGVVIAYGKILSPALLAIPKLGFINVHFSLLPKLRGASPVEHALLEGLSQTGVTTFWLDQGMDTGLLIQQRSLEIQKNETAPELLKRLSTLGQALLMESLDLIQQGKAPRSAQDSSQATYTKLITKEDGKINWQEPAALIERKIRAFSFWPKTWTLAQGRRLQVLQASLKTSGAEGLTPGQIVPAPPSKGFFVKCGEGELFIERVRPEGGRDMAAGQWLQDQDKRLNTLG